MPESNHDRAIGRMEGKLDSLIRTVEAMDRDSAESRGKMHARVDGLARQVSTLEGEMISAKTGIGKLEPVADLVRKWEQRGIGFAAAIAAVGAMFGAALVALKERIMLALGFGP